jgi:hypothetical protein
MTFHLVPRLADTLAKLERYPRLQMIVGLGRRLECRTCIFHVAIGILCPEDVRG